MALTGLYELSSDRRAEISYEGRSYTRTWMGYSDNPNDNAAEITQSALLNWIRTSVHEADPAAICDSITAEAIPEAVAATLWTPGSRHPTWRIITTWRTPRGGARSDQIKIIDPTLRPPDLVWTSVPHQQITRRDALGNPVRNSAGDPYDPEIPVTFYTPAVDITRYEPVSTQIVQRMQMYNGTMNDAVYWGAAPWHAFLVMGPFERISENGIMYWRAHYRVDFRVDPVYFPDGWIQTQMDAGYNEVVDGKKRPILLDDPISGTKTARPTVPQPLDGNGHALPPGGTPHWDQIYRYHATNWGPLAIDYSGVSDAFR